MGKIRQTFEVQGLKELGESLEELNSSTQRNVLRRVLRTIGAVIVADAKQNVHPHKDTGGLEKSIKLSSVKFTKGAAGKAAFAEAMKGGATRAEAGEAAHAANAAAGGEQALCATVVLGPDRRPYAHMLEFGTVHMGPRPYMRPAFDGRVAWATDQFAKELGDEINKAAARAARKAARLANP